ncbi:MAG: HlyD family efflux transporter periplasmic adaptor subunit [Sulfuricella sp.]|nr:HlyD family efflux transporter periplasmic adaptor subunit [Sulfuricella sp.]
MSLPQGEASPANPLLALVELCHHARAAASAEELAFLLVNDSRALAPYRQAALWFEDGGVRTLSGVIQPEGNAPYVQWLDRLCRELCVIAAPQRVTSADVPAAVAAEWADWLPGEAVWLPLLGSADHPGSARGGLLLAGDVRYADATLALLGEWIDAWRHAWLARFRAPPWSAALLREKLSAWLADDAHGKWWRRRPVQIGLAVLAALLFPVRLTVLAPGELVPAHPAVIRAPLDGVIGQIHVQPNAVVKAGQPLFSFDEAPIASRLEMARQALETAETEYRQIAQIALTDAKAKGQLAVLLGKIGEKRAEAEFLQGQFERAQVVTPQDGIAIFDDPSEWIGRPVQTGEKVMRVAMPDEVEIEAWIAVGDAIPLPQQAQTDLYLAASPFSAVSGHMRYVSYGAVPRPDGSYAYRLRAALDGATGQRIGLKGTARIYGGRVPFCYWVLRRPLAAVHQFLAL